jgi:hypothetical protein
LINTAINSWVKKASGKCVEGNKTHFITHVFPKSYFYEIITRKQQGQRPKKWLIKQHDVVPHLCDFCAG